MELVYLWVEEYKNIHKQGFNFSPRFECEYKDGNLTICDKNKDECKDNNYIENFFGNNINITAIVGKNGSGKSSVLKLILYLIFCKNYKKFEKEGDYNIGRLVSTLKQFSNKELFLLIYNGQELKKITFSSFIRHLQTIEFGDEITTRMLSGSSSIESEIVPHIAELTRDELNFFTIHFNYMLDTMYDGVQDNWIKEIYHKADTYQTPLLLEPYKNNNNKQLIDLEIIEYLNNQNMLRFYSSFQGDKKLVDFFTPKTIKFKLAKIENRTLKELKGDYEFVKKETYKLVDKYFELIIKFKLDSRKDHMFDIQNAIVSIYQTSQYENINILYVAFKILLSNKELFNPEIHSQLLTWFKNDISRDALIPRDILIVNRKFKSLFHATNSFSNYEIRKIQSCIDFLENDTEEKDKLSEILLHLDVSHNIKKIQGVLKLIPPWIEVEWFEDEKSIKSLSSGEKSFFTFIINLMYQVQNINDRPEYNTINLFLDETELGFHPQWQKEYLIKIIKAIKAIEQVNNKKVNLIFATHSPFLLSDLPKENVIFLDTYKEDEDINQKKGNCRNVTDTTDINPFGANIHTLLSDGFFMEGGLMGEFAKGKIQEILNFLDTNKDEKPKTIEESQVLSIIKSIGEDFLREKLLSMYDDKFEVSKKEKIKRLKEELAELEK